MHKYSILKTLEKLESELKESDVASYTKSGCSSKEVRGEGTRIELGKLNQRLWRLLASTAYKRRQRKKSEEDFVSISKFSHRDRMHAIASEGSEDGLLINILLFEACLYLKVRYLDVAYFLSKDGILFRDRTNMDVPHGINEKNSSSNITPLENKGL